VIHDVGLPHFRLKMDAVPGIPTTIWFTPKYTTEEMKKITGNKDFVYEISCDQMCGSGHYSMKGIIVVETEAEYNAWLAGKKPQYVTVMEGKKSTAAAPAADSATAKPIAQLSK
jgi:cytochrome c oxidase subunit 2